MTNWPRDYLLSTDNKIGLVHHVDQIDDALHSKLTFETLSFAKDHKERFTFEIAVERAKKLGCSPVMRCLKCFPGYGGEIIYPPK